MSNSEPSAIVLHGIACIGGLYKSFDSKLIEDFAAARCIRDFCCAQASFPLADSWLPRLTPRKALAIISAGQ